MQNFLNSQLDKATVKGVIFDLDGTLVSSNLNFSKIRQEIGCPDGTDILTFIDELACAVSRKQASDKVIANELKDAASSEIITGVKAMLMRLQQWQMPTAVVTRNCRAATDLKLSRHNLNFEITLTRECAAPKPDPASLLEIAQSWDIQTEHLIYVGDYIYDIHTAHNAGMRSVLMTFDALMPSAVPKWHNEAMWRFSNYQQLLDKIATLMEG